MTKEDKTLTTVLMTVALAFFIGYAVATVLVGQEVDVVEYQYEQLEEQHNQLTEHYNQLIDQHWNLQQDYLKLESQ